MQISIKKIDGTSEDFNVESSDKVSKLKEVLAEKSGINQEQIRLIYKGQPMKDNLVSSIFDFSVSRCPSHP